MSNENTELTVCAGIGSPINAPMSTSPTSGSIFAINEIEFVTVASPFQKAVITTGAFKFPSKVTRPSPLTEAAEGGLIV